jgi:hypothetical protein
MLPAGRRHWQGIRCEQERSQAADEAALRDGGNELQGALVTARTSLQVEGEDPFEQPCPAKARGNRAGYRLDALLSRYGDDGALQLTMCG